MKLCIVSAIAAKDREPVKMARIAFFRRNYELAKSPDTVISFLSPTGGVMGIDMPWDAASSAYAMALNAAGTLETVVEAERLGFDAAIIHCGHDPAVLEAKQAVSIPVVGLLEAAATMATLMAGSYGVILIDENARRTVSEAIHRYGLAGKLVGLRPFPASLREQEQDLGQPARVGLEQFKFVARQLLTRRANT